MDRVRGREKLDAFFAAGKESRFDRHDIVIGFDEKPDKAYWIKKGWIKITSYSKDGVERIQHIYQEKEVFPVRWIFEREQNDVTFIAFTDVVMMTRPIRELLTFIEREPETMLAIIHQQTAVFDGLVNLNYETAEERVIFKLITLARRFSTDKAYPLASCQMTVQELASSVRVSSATTGKILNKLERHGAVALKRHNILVDPCKLQSMLDSLSYLVPSKVG